MGRLKEKCNNSVAYLITINASASAKDIVQLPVSFGVTVLSVSSGSFRIGRYQNTGADQTISLLVTKHSKKI
jgi:hypothetical protein